MTSHSHTHTFALGPLIGRHFNQKLSSFGLCVSVQSGWTLNVGRGTQKAVKDRHCSTACNTLGNHISAFCILQCRQRTNVAAKHLFLGRCVCKWTAFRILNDSQPIFGQKCQLHSPFSHSPNAILSILLQKRERTTNQQTTVTVIQSVFGIPASGTFTFQSYTHARRTWRGFPMFSSFREICDECIMAMICALHTIVSVRHRGQEGIIKLFCFKSTSNRTRSQAIINVWKVASSTRLLLENKSNSIAFFRRKSLIVYPSFLPSMTMLCTQFTWNPTRFRIDIHMLTHSHTVHVPLDLCVSISTTNRRVVQMLWSLFYIYSFVVTTWPIVMLWLYKSHPIPVERREKGQAGVAGGIELRITCPEFQRWADLLRINASMASLNWFRFTFYRHSIHRRQVKCSLNWPIDWNL